MWLNRNDEFVVDGELASVTEELLGDNRRFIESRDQKHVYAACCPTSEQESSPRMQMDRGIVEIEEARQTRERRASVLTTDKEKDEYEVMRTVLRSWCNSCVRNNPIDAQQVIHQGRRWQRIAEFPHAVCIRTRPRCWC